jgi:hypothetical protein
MEQEVVRRREDMEDDEHPDHLVIERIVLLDFIHCLVSQKTNKIEELKL